MHVGNDIENIDDVFDIVRKRDPGEKEFQESVREVLTSLKPVLDRIPETMSVLKRLVEPETVVMFRVAWVDDLGTEQVNRGIRVQFNSALGLYKGGLRFHPTVNLDLLKHLAFEQTMKNALAPLPMGGGKGGSDFDPKGKSDAEIMRFCQAFAIELNRYIGPSTDVPAGDIGVGAHEIGYMFGMFRKIRNSWEGVLTGKDVDYGGSHLRPEATGYGLVYFAERACQYYQNCTLEGMKCMLSGSGNVSLYTAEKLLHRGAQVLTLSDSQGTCYFPKGIRPDQLQVIMDKKFERRERLANIEIEDSQYFPNQKPWTLKRIEEIDLALPCATQGELDQHDAEDLVKKRVRGVFEGANAPCEAEVISYFHSKNVIHAPSKASNIGGVATSGFEIAQNSQRLQWTSEEVDTRLHNVMLSVFDKVVDACKRYGISTANLRSGANIAAFERVSRAMIQQGIV